MFDSTSILLRLIIEDRKEEIVLKWMGKNL
jgi:hypothetical protein